MDYVWCLGQVSYDERVALPHGVYATVAAAKAQVTLGPGEKWQWDERSKEWIVRRGDYAGYDSVVRRYQVEALAESAHRA